jgi:SNF2 family DNA or RNA helicase
LEFKAHDYQQFAIEKVKNNKITGLLLEMGLGKTISTLSAINDLMFDHFTIARVLVIAPLRVAQDTWPEEIKKWDHLKHLKVSLILGDARERKRALEAEADIYVINRENVIWLIEEFGHYVNKKKQTGFTFDRPWKFDTVVLDELSNYKDQGTKRFKLLKKARPYMDRVIGLTGTPSPNSLIDLWAQMYLLDMGERLGKTITGYRERYFMPSSYTKNSAGRLIATGYELRPGSEEAIYQAIGDICVSMKSIDHLQLPEVFSKIIPIRLPKAARAVYDELEKESIVELQGGQVIDAESAASVSSKLHQLAQGAIYLNPVDDLTGEVRGPGPKEWKLIHDEKLDALEELIDEAAGNPVLVFYWFKHDLERLKARFKQAQTLDGPQQIQNWNAGKVPLLLAHPMSAGHGLNLQAGGHIIAWYSLTWSLELYQQANARLNRQGQTKPVTINHLVVKDTIDERILEVLEGKASRQDALMEAVKAVLTKHVK